jgi:molybdenum-dependent DNA-binding transcriptional regulator ModE
MAALWVAPAPTSNEDLSSIHEQRLSVDWKVSLALLPADRFNPRAMRAVPVNAGRTCLPPRTINLARLDFVSLQLIVQCASTGSLSGAASACHCSVMAASDRLRRVEEALGRTLFERHRRGLAPTEAGWRAVRAAEGILQQVDAMVADVQSAGEEPPRHAANVGRAGKGAQACGLGCP